MGSPIAKWSSRGDINFGSDKNAGLLVQGTLPAMVTVENVIVEYADVSEAVQTQIDAGKNFFMFGSSGLSMAKSTERFKNSYAISTAPVLQLAKMQTEQVISGNNHKYFNDIFHTINTSVDGFAYDVQSKLYEYIKQEQNNIDKLLTENIEH